MTGCGHRQLEAWNALGKLFALTRLNPDDSAAMRGFVSAQFVYAAFMGKRPDEVLVELERAALPWETLRGSERCLRVVPDDRGCTCGAAGVPGAECMEGCGT